MSDIHLGIIIKNSRLQKMVDMVHVIRPDIVLLCGDIVDELPLAQSTVSQHLKVLKEAGLVKGEIDGPRVCYCVEPRAMRRLKALVGSL